MLGNLAKSLIPIAIMGGLQYAQQGGGATAATLSATAQSFIDSTDPEKGRQVFGNAPTPIQSRTPDQLAAGSRRATAGVQLDPITKLMRSDPRLESAMIKLLENSSNQHIIDLFAKHSNVTMTAKGGQPTTRMTEIR